MTLKDLINIIANMSQPRYAMRLISSDEVANEFIESVNSIHNEKWCAQIDIMTQEGEHICFDKSYNAIIYLDDGKDSGSFLDVSQCRDDSYDLEMCDTINDAYQYANDCSLVGIIPQEVFVHLKTVTGENIDFSKTYYMVVYRKETIDE